MVFSNAIKASGSYTVDLAMECPRDVVYQLFPLLCFIFYGATPAPYVQAVILNLSHPYVRSTTVHLGTFHLITSATQ